jgi:nitroimidazol reductase NimA-like FMN-containing flavoprotein (pyridoxamine 5'-phosphate oxidase superfamily)
MPLAGSELKAFLEESRLAHFATTGADGAPRVRPIWFWYADRAFWFTTRLEARVLEPTLRRGRLSRCRSRATTGRSVE